MCYSHLSMLQEILSEQQIENFETYLGTLVGSASENITASKIARTVGISIETARKALIKCNKAGIMSMSYAIRCPKCHMLIKKVESISEIPKDSFECYGCEEMIDISPADIEILYSIVDKRVFIDGQQYDYKDLARTVAHEDSLESMLLAGGANELLFCPTEDEYIKLDKMYTSVKNRKGNTKDIGDTLENLTIELFNLCKVFKAAGIRTTTNQIDCCVVNKIFIPYGVLNTIGERFLIECKNENETPSGGYMLKLASIITNANAGGKQKCIQFGIIISKEKGPRTFKELANKFYLSAGIVIISICCDEIKRLIDERGNLLEMIDRKASEIMLDSTTDLKKAGLYKS